MLIIILNYKNFSNIIILIQLKNHFKIQLNRLHIQLHPILPDTFITKTMANVQLCALFFVTTPPHMLSGMLFYMPQAVTQWGML